VPVDHVEPVHRPIKLTDPVEQIATRKLGPRFQSRRFEDWLRRLELDHTDAQGHG